MYMSQAEERVSDVVLLLTCMRMSGRLQRDWYATLRNLEPFHPFSFNDYARQPLSLFIKLFDAVPDSHCKR